MLLLSKKVIKAQKYSSLPEKPRQDLQTEIWDTASNLFESNNKFNELEDQLLHKIIF